ncbi:MAG: hypothetical protein SVR08_06395 [Spirochaetota bacterium]|nr:hypothetical protein [Spirochaetota bacterium]
MSKVLLIIFTLTIFITSITETAAQDMLSPIFYPEGEINNNSPYFIWQDIYNKRDKKYKTKYRLSIKGEKSGDIKPILFTPKLYYKEYFVFRSPIELPYDKYNYTIELMSENRPLNSRFFNYIRYPINMKFTNNPETSNEYDNLPPELLIKYLFLDRNNTLINKYNIYFFSTSGAAALGIGILFYKIIDLGLFSTIISSLSFTSSAFGVAAAGYYGYRFVQKKKELQRIIDIGKNITLNGNVNHDKIDTAIELTF